MTNEPVLLDACHLKPAAVILGKAFKHDPLMQYFVPDEIRRARILPALFEMTVRYCLRYGEVYTTAAVEGVACWLTPGNTTFRIGRMLRCGITLSPFDFGLEGLRRFIRISNFTEALHKSCIAGSHWYLWAIGVDPRSHGRGIGGGLLQPVLAKAAAERLPCYLETQNERNVSFYQKHGFEIARAERIPGTDLHVWAMLRH
ncbi:MAG: GNAT family N-acetyltransferase [Ktedonobacteraceae bacterium]|nr:GNAT family N-acetyltransferase [Ktedonobacteraceae bacterium]